MKIQGVRRLWQRVYADYFRPPRFSLYRELLELALEQGYELLSPLGFWERITGDHPASTGRVLILRHDIDTDPTGALFFYEIERQLDAAAGYYFRLSTADSTVIQEIATSKAEVGYHYEEIATYSKQYCLKTSQQVIEHLPAIRALFSRNLDNLRNLTGLPISTAVSHGDFANRHLHMTNSPILEDEAFRNDVCIRLELYDRTFMDKLSTYCSDFGHPPYWKPVDPFQAIRKQEPIVCVLTHPRHWRSSPRANLRADLTRLLEGTRYSTCIH